MDLRTRGGGRGSWDEVREWHGHIYTTKCKIIASGKQQHSTGRSAQCFVFTQRGGIGRVGGRRKREGIWGYMYTFADSLCYTAETNTTL